MAAVIHCGGLCLSYVIFTYCMSLWALRVPSHFTNEEMGLGHVSGVT